MTYDVVSGIIAFESGTLDDEATLELFQYLVNTGMAWTLQGSYGRMAVFLLEQGLIQPARSYDAAEPGCTDPFCEVCWLPAEDENPRA